MEATVLRFLAFLGAEFLFLIASTATIFVVGLLVMKSGQLRARYVFAAGIASSVVSVLFLMFFLWILTGNGYARFFLSILAVSLVLMFLAEFLWLVFGQPNVPWVERTLWHSRELEMLFPFIKKAEVLIVLAVLIIYPIYIGMGYFGEEFESAQWQGYVLRATLVAILGVGYLVGLPPSLYVMMSRNIAEGTRSRIFINQLVQSIVVLMIISFFVWTLDPDAVAVPLGIKLLAFTPIVLYTTLAYVAFLLAIPYLIGHFRYKAWAMKLDGDLSRIVNELLVGARSPLLDTAKEALVDAKSNIDENLEELAGDESYRLTDDVSNGGRGQNPLYTIVAERSVQRDPRFIHTKKLTGLRRQIDDCLAALTAASTDKDKRDLLKNFGDTTYQQAQSENQDKSGRPWVLAGITTIVLAIANPIITALGKRVASIFGLSVE